MQVIFLLATLERQLKKLHCHIIPNVVYTEKEVIKIKSTGLFRKVDELGRIVLPIELRKSFHIKEKDSLEIFVDGDKIILKKYESGDIFTGEMDDLITYCDKEVSLDSIKKMAEIAGYELTEK